MNPERLWSTEGWGIEVYRYPDRVVLAFIEDDSRTDNVSKRIYFADIRGLYSMLFEGSSDSELKDIIVIQKTTKYVRTLCCR